MTLESPRWSLDPTAVADAEAALRDANLAFVRRYPGENDRTQPVHTFIEGAQRFSFDVARRRAKDALHALDTFAPTGEDFGRAMGIRDHPKLGTIMSRLREKLDREPIEDYRIDFEDGFGVKTDAEEDREVASAALEISRGRRAHSLPPALGVRIKPLTEELRGRAVRTLDLLLTALAADGGVPPRWTITIPKVTVVEQVDYTVAVLRALERSLGFSDGALTFEIMIEVPQAIVDRAGRSLVPSLVDAADGRLTAITFGTYDYTAGVGITAAHQRLRHPACDFAKNVIQVSLAGTGIHASDGSTSRLPVPPHDGRPTTWTPSQRSENLASVHAGWRLHFDDVRYSLSTGFYQGWDLHAAQLISRYAAVSSFYLEGIDAAAARLKAFLDKAKNVALVGGVLDEPATGQGLFGFFLRAIRAGAVSAAEVSSRTGLSSEELREQSMISILRARGTSVDAPPAR
jgi:citrate lyase beta subunit